MPTGRLFSSSTTAARETKTARMITRLSKVSTNLFSLYVKKTNVKFLSDLKQIVMEVPARDPA